VGGEGNRKKKTGRRKKKKKGRENVLLVGMQGRASKERAVGLRVNDHQRPRGGAKNMEKQKGRRRDRNNKK